MSHNLTFLLIAFFLVVASQQALCATPSIIGSTYNMHSKPNNDSIFSIQSNDATFNDRFEVNLMVYQIAASAIDRESKTYYLAKSGYELLSVKVLPQITIEQHQDLNVVPQFMHWSPNFRKLVVCTMHNTNKISFLDVNTTMVTPIVDFNNTWGLYLGPDTYDHVRDRVYFTIGAEANYVVQVDVRQQKITKMIKISEKLHGDVPANLEFCVQTGNLLATMNGHLVEINVETEKLTPIALLAPGIPSMWSSAYDEVNGIFYYSSIHFLETYYVAIDVKSGKVSYRNVYDSYKHTHWYMR